MKKKVIPPLTALLGYPVQNIFLPKLDNFIYQKFSGFWDLLNENFVSKFKGRRCVFIYISQFAAYRQFVLVTFYCLYFLCGVAFSFGWGCLWV